MGQFTLLLAAIVGCSFGESLGAGKPRCGDWIPFKDEKCIKVAHKAVLENQEDAEAVCKAFSEELNRESFPNLITIKSQEDQDFLHQLLFAENKVIDNVWLGLKLERNNENFKWNDGSELTYSKWVNQTSSVAEHQCVELASGNGGFAAGSWIKVNCQKRNRVVCERNQTWSLELLQNMFLQHKIDIQKEIKSLKLEHDAQMKTMEHVHEQQITALTQEIKAQLENRKQNPVPEGFIYVQLPGQEPPTSLWPFTSWTEVSSTYAGLFFRVEGGNAAPFGQVQEESTKRLDQVHAIRDGASSNPIFVPANGSWSATIHTGIYTSHEWVYALKFRLSTEEVRPRNQAIRVWRRT